MFNEFTTKQLNFANAIIAGETHERAYAIAYPKSEKNTVAYRNKKANKLLNETKGLREYISLKKYDAARIAAENAQKKAIWNREKSIVAAAFIAECGIWDLKRAKKRIEEDYESTERVLTGSDCAGVLSAVKLLNELTGGDGEDHETLASKILALDPDNFSEDVEEYRAGGPKG